MRNTLLLVLLLTLSGCTENNGGGMATISNTEFALSKITDKVYVIHGPNELPNKSNRGFMNNPGFVLTSKGVAIIDPGSSIHVGRMLLEKIRSVTQAPVIAVFNTHIHGDHWLANGSIKSAFPKAVIYAHPKMKEQAAVEGENWIKLINRLTDNAITGTQAVSPDIPVDNGDSLKLGDTEFRFHHNGQAHTKTDIMIEVVEQGVLFLGDNVFNQRIGRMDDGNFQGNIAAIDIALKTDAKHFVPGHGPSGGREVAQAYRDYLHALYDNVKQLYNKDMLDFEMKPLVIEQLAKYQSWNSFDTEVGRHIARAYLQIEEQLF